MNKLEKYIHLILKLCVNLSNGQNLLIWCPVEGADFAYAVMQAAYKMGAKNVEVFYEDKRFVSFSSSIASANLQACHSEWVQARNDYWKKENYKMLWLYTSDYATLKDFEPKIAQSYCPSMPQLFWRIAYIATPQWAKLLYPNLNSEGSVSHLWEDIFSACRIDENDPIANWKDHIEVLHKHLSILNNYHFKSLHFSNSAGTDLSVDLHDQHKWISCTGETEQGMFYVTNLPTEEVFTAPSRKGVNGTVIVSRPIILLGDTVDGIQLTFENGKVIKATAKKNQHLLENFLSENENACYLGEVALVSKSSPIAQMGLFWRESSFDENIACHLAFGSGYPSTILNSDGKNSSELIKTGLNQSDIHEDFMIGTTDITVVGRKKDRAEVKIITDGEWVIL